MSDYREILSKHGVVMSYTKGVSMRPLIWEGHHCVGVVPVDEPQIDDMLLFEQMRSGEKVTILHRLVRIEGDIYVTRGDNCLGVERVRRSDIIGRATDIYRIGPHQWRHAINAEHINICDKAYQRYVRRLKRKRPLKYLCLRLRYAASKVGLLRALYHKLRKSER